jgi:hypothetical protein
MERKYRLKPKRKDRVFPRNGEGFDTRSSFHPAMEEAEIAYYALHYNRHTFCSWLRLLACHTTIAITAQYAHLCPDHKQSEVEKMLVAPSQKPISFSGATQTATDKNKHSEQAVR